MKCTSKCLKVPVDTTVEVKRNSEMEPTLAAADDRGASGSSQLDSTLDPNHSNGTCESTQKALECPLCLSLICEPLSISCGHSFCRVCLVKSLRRLDVNI